MSEKLFDVTIVGGGVGGLTCGSFLAKNGLKVLLLEKHSRVGGYCNSWERKGFRFDGGAEAILGCGEGGYVRRILEGLGVVSDLDFNRILPFEHIITPDFELSLATLPEFKEGLLKIFPEEEKAIETYFKTVLKIQKAVISIGTGAPSSFFAKLKFALKNLTAAKYYKKTFAELLDNCGITKDKIKLRGLLTTHWAWLGTPPSRTWSYMAGIVYLDALMNGLWHVEGGIQKLPDALADSMQKHGGVIRTKTGVEKILVEDGEAKGVKLEDGEKIRSKYVVSNADTKATFLELVGKEHLEKDFARKIEEVSQSFSGFIVYLGVEMDIKWKYPFTALIKEYDAEKMFEKIQKGELVKDFIAVRIPSLIDPSYAPQGKHTVNILTIQPYSYQNAWNTKKGKGEEYKKLKEKITDQLIEEAEDILPGLSDHIIVKDAATPITFERYTGNSEGGWYGPLPDEKGFPILSEETPISNLFLAGHNAGGGGVPSVIISGWRTATSILTKTI